MPGTVADEAFAGRGPSVSLVATAGASPVGMPLTSPALGPGTPLAPKASSMFATDASEGAGAMLGAAGPVVGATAEATATQGVSRTVELTDAVTVSARSGARGAGGGSVVVAGVAVELASRATEP